MTPRAPGIPLLAVFLSATLLAACHQACDSKLYYCGLDTGSPPVDSDSTPRTISTNGGWEHVASGYFHSCALQDGVATCWGLDDYGQTDAPEAAQFSEIAAGATTTCGCEGQLLCWGELADMTMGTLAYSSAAIGLFHLCYIREGAAECSWSDRIEFDDGQANPPSGSFTGLSAGAYNTCGIDDAGALVCWGAGRGEGTEHDVGQSLPPAGAFTALGLGWLNGCAIDDAGALQCWGADDEGQSEPPAGTYSAVSCGAAHCCALDTAGGVSCWGDDDAGQSTPPADVTWVEVSAGGDHTCGIDDGGFIRCWGEDATGETYPP